MAKGERKRALRGRAGRMKGGRGSGRATAGHARLWGRHAVEAALKNPARSHRKLWATREGIESLDGELPPDFPVEYADVLDLARLVAKDAPHQGLVLECEELPNRFLDEFADADPAHPLVVLDQVTDPHNVGAILRSKKGKARDVFCRRIRCCCNCHARQAFTARIWRGREIGVRSA